MTARVPSSSVRRVFRNDTAAAIWIFEAAWIGILGCFTWLAWRDGGIPQVGRWTWPMLGMFWLFGLGVISWGARFALLRIVLSADGVQVRERYPLHVRVARYRSRDIAAPQVVATRDSEGDEQFACVLDLPGPRRVVVKESVDRARAQRTCDELLASLRALCRGFGG
jgi:hypothetical protein